MLPALGHPLPPEEPHAGLGRRKGDERVRAEGRAVRLGPVGDVPAL